MKTEEKSILITTWGQQEQFDAILDHLNSAHHLAALLPILMKQYYPISHDLVEAKKLLQSVVIREEGV